MIHVLRTVRTAQSRVTCRVRKSLWGLELCTWTGMRDGGTGETRWSGCQMDRLELIGERVG